MTGREAWSLVAPILAAFGERSNGGYNKTFDVDAYTLVYAALTWWDESEEYREKARESKWTIPSADRPTGEWEMQDVGGVELWAVCSECGHINFSKTDIEGNHCDGNFCPNCGADMRGEEE